MTSRRSDRVERSRALASEEAWLRQDLDREGALAGPVVEVDEHDRLPDPG